MDRNSDLLQDPRRWLGTLGLFLATFTTVLRALLGFDETRRQHALSYAAALFIIGFVAPGVCPRAHRAGSPAFGDRVQARSCPFLEPEVSRRDRDLRQGDQHRST